MNLIIISATKGKKENTKLFNSFHKTPTISIKFYENNTLPLANIYNDAIKEHKNNADWLLFIHDDVILESLESLPRKINELGDNYDVIGLAGSTEAKLQSPVLWHLMSDRSKHRGAVAHLMNNSKYMTSFGPYPSRVVIIDGVFIAVKTKVVEEITFDESNPAGFHFYDLDFSMACHKAGFKVGVGDITITHASPGLREFTDEWKSGEKWFLNKWKPQN